MATEIFSDDFEMDMGDIVDISYAETECQDFRIDFDGGYSLWLRGGKCVEGIAPKRYKKKIDTYLKNVGVTNYVDYQ